jgi:hypothetical protein
MPIHDWTKVDAGIFHALHLHWIAAIDGALNDGLLPPDYYSLPEIDFSINRKARSVVVRHINGHRIIALIEIVSSSNKGSKFEIDSLIKRTVEFLRNGIHLIIIDLFPPGPCDPRGIHSLIWSELRRTSFELPADKPLTITSYVSRVIPEAYLDPLAIGDSLTNMPLFLTPDLYVQVPLDKTYSAAWGKVPRPWREVLE